MRCEHGLEPAQCSLCSEEWMRSVEETAHLIAKAEKPQKYPYRKEHKEPSKEEVEKLFKEVIEILKTAESESELDAMLIDLMKIGISAKMCQKLKAKILHDKEKYPAKYPKPKKEPEKKPYKELRKQFPFVSESELLTMASVKDTVDAIEEGRMILDEVATAGDYDHRTGVLKGSQWRPRYTFEQVNAIIKMLNHRSREKLLRKSIGTPMFEELSNIPWENLARGSLKPQKKDEKNVSGIYSRI